MLGSIIGDIVGSRFEHHNIKSKKFHLFASSCRATDDSIMSLAVAKAIIECKGDYVVLGDVAVRCMQEVGRNYPYCGFGGMFKRWLFSDNPKPYNSFGNGAAMRISPCGYAGRSLEEVKLLSRKVTEVTHNHHEGIKGAEAAAVAVFLARQGRTISQIKEYMDTNYYSMDFTLDGIREEYRFDVTCQGSVPQALMAFFESAGFEDAIRNAVSIGGDSDTIAAITGGIAGAYYGIPDHIRSRAVTYLDERLLKMLNDFEDVFLQA